MGWCVYTCDWEWVCDGIPFDVTFSYSLLPLLFDRFISGRITATTTCL